MRRRVSLSAAAALCAATVFLSGCGNGSSEAADGTPLTGGAPSTKTHDNDSSRPSTAKLDAYVGAAERGMKGAVGPSVRRIYSSMRILPVYSSGIKYVYTYKNHVDATRGAAALDKQVPLLKATYRTQVAAELKRLGFAHPSVTWTFLNSDGSLIWTHTVRG
jgi:hypothetical protein